MRARNDATVKVGIATRAIAPHRMSFVVAGAGPRHPLRAPTHPQSVQHHHAQYGIASALRAWHTGL
jgi:hypothetical protein